VIAPPARRRLVQACDDRQCQDPPKSTEKYLGGLTVVTNLLGRAGTQ
jgi:hypothetical protein